jgi:uncharacterized protein (TIGR01777 family)
VKVLLTGASGLLGSALMGALRTAGHEALPLVRAPHRSPPSMGRWWDPAGGVLEPRMLAGVDAIVNLQGEPILGRWTPAKKARLRQSRVDATQLLCGVVARASPRPRVFVSASGVGYYGDRGDELLTETSPPGDGFLPALCCDWEAAALTARDAGLRVVLLRIAPVLAPRGGVLGPMLLPFKLGLGVRLGSGAHYQPWIALEDVVGVMQLALGNERIAGPVNVVAPQAVTNAEFTRALARVLGRPAFLSAPRWALRVLLGAIADEGLLSSARVVPERLIAAGFVYRQPELEPALRSVLSAKQV